MMPEIRRSILLAAVGLFGGFALVVALFGTEELFKRNAAVNPSAETPASPKNPLIGSNSEGRTGETPATDLSHDGPGAPSQAETGPVPVPAPAETARKDDEDDTAPSFDIVRVEPDGGSVIAGRARPHARIEILRDGRPFASVSADAAGQFALTPPDLPPGSSEIALRATDADGKPVDGRESVTVVVAERRDTKPLIALSAPDRPTRVLSQPEAPEPPAKSVATEPPGAPASIVTRKDKPADKTDKTASAREGIRIVSIDAQEGGRLDVTSQAPAGSTLRLYLNDTLVASGHPGPDGRLAFTIGRGVKAGQYKIRVDSVDPAGGKVKGRAEVAFAYPDIAPSRLAEAGWPQKAQPVETRQQAGASAPLDRTPQPKQPPAQPQRAEAKPAEPRPPRSVHADAKPAEPKRDEPRRAETRQDETKQDETRQMETKPAEKPSQSLALTSPKPAGPAAQPPQRTASSEPRADAAPTSQDKPAAGPPPASPESASGMGKSPAGTAYVAEVSTARISRGDSLWQISRRTYGRGNRYTVIYDANQDQIRDPDLIYPGQMFVLPKDDPAIGAPSARTGSGRRT